ncbi:polyketide cyclase / dehydrase and lipid transferase [Brachyspira pilosicoli]|uniref:polyketide cyclase / dehydrase and lipid transferase n=1 Tax=Brachyspira pilosicoli TaxID=52584 RepID=UPI0012F50E1A|nr:polyketide cyclase / dehydrase and lipid transferase [Brachyspira pilosicoli]
MISLFIYKNIMIKSNINKIINCNIKDVFNRVSDFQNYHWRNDIIKVEILSDTNFIEYSKDGYKTFFEITLLENCKSIKLNLENENIKGYFIGNFKCIDNDKTLIDFTKYIEIKNFLKKIIMMPFIKPYINKQQNQYVNDLINSFNK